MNKFIVLLFITLISCAPSLTDVDDQGNILPKEIKKFKDGPITCWIYENNGISCLRYNPQ